MLKNFSLNLKLLFTAGILILASASIGLFMAGGNSEWKGSLLVILGLLVFGVLFIPRLARSAEINVVVLYGAYFVKLLIAIFRIWTDFVFYGGTADAAAYIRNGTSIANSLGQFEFAAVFSNTNWGTEFMNLVTGIFFSVVTPTRTGAYLFFAFLSFLGSYIFYKSFVVAFPKGNARFYMILIFFLPSILFWSNSISKDALIFLFISLITYGGACFLSQGKLSGIIPLAFGFLGTLFIRPHIAILIVICFSLGFLIQSLRRKTFSLSKFVILTIAIGGILWFLFPKVLSFLDLNELSFTGILDSLQNQQELTSIGGSAYKILDISDPSSIPAIFATVFFRPFLWEASNFQTILQSAEGFLLLILTIIRIKSILYATKSSINSGYLVFIFTYIVGFVFIFSSAQNFGILARERTMMFPFYFMLLASSPLLENFSQKIPEVSLSEQVA